MSPYRMCTRLLKTNLLLKLNSVAVFLFSSECKWWLSSFVSDMRRDVQEIFRMTPHEKQVMMFSATLSKEIRPICKKFMQDVIAPLHLPPSHPSGPPPWSPASAFSHAGSGGWWLTTRQLAAFLYPIWLSATLWVLCIRLARASLRLSRRDLAVEANVVRLDRQPRPNLKEPKPKTESEIWTSSLLSYIDLPTRDEVSISSLVVRDVSHG